MNSVSEVPFAQVRFDRATVELDALQRAAYALARDVSVDIRAEDSDWLCSLFSEPSAGHLDPELAVARLRREVIDQTLRLRIAEQTEPIRNLIFALAFANTGLVDEDAAE